MATELSVPKGHGLVRVAHNLRRHVAADRWQSEPGTDYWVIAQHDDALTASGATNISGLDSYGWTTTTLVVSTMTGGDFLDSTDVGTPNAVVFGADTDLLQSPTIFGDYSHGLMAGQFLGYYPTRLVVEVYAAFTTHSANETRTGFGLTEAGGTSGTAADAMAWIHTDGTSFTLRSAADSDAGSADNATFHQFRIVCTVGQTDAIEWFIDGTSQGKMDVQAALWPCSFGAYSSTTNRISLAWCHIYYE